MNSDLEKLKNLVGSVKKTVKEDHSSQTESEDTIENYREKILEKEE